MTAERPIVSYTAAAAVIRMNTKPETKPGAKKATADKRR
jgi:hypothetical protein